MDGADYKPVGWAIPFPCREGWGSAGDDGGREKIRELGRGEREGGLKLGKTESETVWVLRDTVMPLNELSRLALHFTSLDSFCTRSLCQNQPPILFHPPGENCEYTIPNKTPGYWWTDRPACLWAHVEQRGSVESHWPPCPQGRVNNNEGIVIGSPSPSNETLSPYWPSLCLWHHVNHDMMEFSWPQCG